MGKKAFEKISKGLNEAVAYARGDKSAGTTRIVHVPDPLAHTLTGNDIALAIVGAGFAIDWYKKGRGARTKFIKGRIAEHQALLDKLRAIDRAAYPHVTPKYEGEPLPLDIGNEEIMRMNAGVVRRTRAAALKRAAE